MYYILFLKYFDKNFSFLDCFASFNSCKFLKIVQSPVNLLFYENINDYIYFLCTFQIYIYISFIPLHVLI